MANPSSKWFKDAGERVLWTAIAAACSAAIAYSADLHTVYVPAITTALTLVKTIAARYVGNSDSAAMSKE